MMLYAALLVMTVMGSVAAFFLKKAAGGDLKQMLLNINLYIGGGLYLLSALINIYLLKYLPYSVVLPLTSLTYIWTMLIASAKLGEKITKRKIIGVLAVVLGAVAVSL